MLNNIIGIISGTPLLVWVLLGFLLDRAIKALKTRVVPRYTLSTLPTIFVGLSLHTLLTNKNITFAITSLWLISIIIGSTIGWLIAKKAPIAADKKNDLIQLPGSPITLIITLLFFSISYYFGYSLAVNPELMNSLSFLITRLTLGGLTVGVSIGSALGFFYKYLNAAHRDLA